jgi:ElaB/YqjD/DUF883 family membrane-anchored ribosome-binding protein
VFPFPAEGNGGGTGERPDAICQWQGKSVALEPIAFPVEKYAMSEMSEVSKQKLIADLKVVIADAEEILKATAGQAGEKMADLRARLQEHLASARHNLAEAQAAVVERTRQVARATDDYVHDNPWRSIGIAAGIGFVIGLLIGRR